MLVSSYVKDDLFEGSNLYTCIKTICGSTSDFPQPLVSSTHPHNKWNLKFVKKGFLLTFLCIFFLRQKRLMSFIMHIVRTVGTKNGEIIPYIFPCVWSIFLKCFLRSAGMTAQCGYVNSLSVVNLIDICRNANCKSLMAESCIRQYWDKVLYLQ